MGFLDKAKSKLSGAVNQHGDRIEDGIDKVGDLVNDKTGGKHTDKIGQAGERAKNALDGLDGRDDAR